MMALETPSRAFETPERPAVRLPRHPGPGGRVVKCEGRGGACGQTLGVVDGPYLFVRHAGRELVSGLPCTLRCERCGQWGMIQG